MPNSHDVAVQLQCSCVEFSCSQSVSGLTGNHGVTRGKSHATIGVCWPAKQGCSHGHGQGVISHLVYFIGELLLGSAEPARCASGLVPGTGARYIYVSKRKEIRIQKHTVQRWPAPSAPTMESYMSCCTSSLLGPQPHSAVLRKYAYASRAHCGSSHPPSHAHKQMERPLPILLRSTA